MLCYVIIMCIQYHDIQRVHPGAALETTAWSSWMSSSACIPALLSPTGCSFQRKGAMMKGGPNVRLSFIYTMNVFYLNILHVNIFHERDSYNCNEY